MIGVIKGTMRQKKEVNGLPLPIASYKANLKAPIRSLKVAITAVQSGSGNPAPDNIRPIIGVSECNVVRCGINLWDEETERGAYDLTTGLPITQNSLLRCVNPISVKPNTNYYIKVGSTNARVFFYDMNDNFISVTELKNTFTTPSNCYIVRFYCNGTYGTTYNNDISVNYPATDTSYHAYTGNTYTIQLGDTCYGGSLNVTNGVLMVTHEIIDLSDVTFNTYNYGASNTFYGYISTKKFGLGNFICDKYSTYTGVITNMPNYSIRGQANTNNIYVRNTDCETSAEIHEALNGTHLVYELATPISVQLTPAQVEQLLGANNVWADTGDVEELVYTDRQVYYGR